MSKVKRMYLGLWAEEQKQNEANMLNEFMAKQKDPAVLKQQRIEDNEEVSVEPEKFSKTARNLGAVETSEFPKGRDNISSIKQAKRKVIAELQEQRGG